MQLLPQSARAGVFQAVHARQTVNGMVTNVDDESVFGVVSADITQDILAQVGTFPALRYQAVSAASEFGSVGLSTAVVESGVAVSATVFIESDEFVNVTGVPQRATASFIIDGGSLFITFGRDLRASYELTVEAWNLGNVPITTSRIDLAQAAFDAPGFPFSGHRFLTEGTLEADAAGAVTFVTSGKDIGAVLDSQLARVEIPPSLQSLDLGILNPGDRVYLSYRLLLFTEVTGGSEGIFSRFSDPLNLSGSPAFPVITFTPIPEPSTVVLPIIAAIGVSAFTQRRRGCRWRTVRG
jgi:hypothetical protein